MTRAADRTAARREARTRRAERRLFAASWRYAAAFDPQTRAPVLASPDAAELPEVPNMVELFAELEAAVFHFAEVVPVPTPRRRRRRRRSQPTGIATAARHSRTRRSPTVARVGASSTAATSTNSRTQAMTPRPRPQQPQSRKPPARPAGNRAKNYAKARR